MRQVSFVVGVLLSLTFQVFSGPLLFSEEQPQASTPELSFNRTWAERAFASMRTLAAAADRLTIVHEGTPGDTRRGYSSAGGKLSLGEKTYTAGVGVSAKTVLHVELTKPAASFRADIGVDQFYDSMTSSVRFLVEAGGRKIFTSDFMKPSAGPRSIDVPLNGVKEFNLLVEAAPDSKGSGRADWADAKVLLQDGSQLQLDELADHWDVENDLPFSFTLGGQSSRDLVRQWKRDVRQEQIDSKTIRRTVTLQDSKTGLGVRGVATIYTDTPGTDWTLYLSNHGTTDSPVIENLKALDIVIDAGKGTPPILQRLKGSEALPDDWQPYEDTLKPGQKIEFAPVNGRSSQGASAFFALQYGGGGVVTGIGWSGGWNAATEWRADGKVHLQAGLKNLHLKLHPGETIRSPRIMQTYWFGEDRFRGYNLFRSTMFSHILPRIDGAIVPPPIVHMSTSFYESNDSTESNVLSYLDSIKGLGFEAFWLDAYWTKGGFPEGMGNYGFPIQKAEPSDRFPHGLKPIGDAVHKEGMQFVVWFEPERVYRGTSIAMEHPDWVITVPKSQSGLYNLGLPEAREFMTKYLIAAMKEYGVDVMRIDYNIAPGPYWEQLDARDPDRVGMAEIRYIEGFYQMWDDIRKAFPRLYIDNCASGGRRIDLETSSRSLPLWRTDGTIEALMNFDFDQSALQNQVMTAGLSRYVPFSTSGQMGATPYLFRSGFNAGTSFAEDTRPASYPRDLLKQAIAEGKRIRKYYFGNFYALNEVTISAEDWSVMQYHRPTEQDGMVMAFRRHHSAYGSYGAVLREVAPEEKYEVTFYPTYEAARTVSMSGAELQHLKLDIPESPGSLLVEYKKTH